MIQWLRAARLTIASPTGNYQLGIDGLRISFSIEKKRLPPEPHRADINVFNRNREHRMMIHKADRGSDKVLVTLEVAYLGLKVGAVPNYGVIFSGNVRTIDHLRRGADWVTRVQCGDGERSWRALTKNSFAPNARIDDVIRKVAADTGLSPGNLATALAGGTDGVKKLFAKGFTLQGKAADELTKLLGPRGFDWTSEEGALQLVRKGKALPVDAIIVSEETGLINSPEHGAPERNYNRSTIKLEMLMNNLVKPGVPLKVISASINGMYTPTSIVHRGDTHSDDWKTLVEIRQLG